MLPWLDAAPVGFPAVADALDEPDGLLAAGGALTPEWLLTAYMNGIFPWFNEDDPILWWSPDPRLVLYPDEFHCRRSLAKRLRNGGFTVTFNQCFDRVMQLCGETRQHTTGTWISPEMCEAYGALHRLGFAHSVEVWRAGDLVGGLYGVALGHVFFGESMFSRCPDASKVALAHLVAALKQAEFVMIDCQAHTDHLASLGAVNIPRNTFIDTLSTHASLLRWAPNLRVETIG